MTSKYLEKYAEPEAKEAYKLLALSTRTYAQVIVIPAFREPIAFAETLVTHLNKQPNTIAIVVINQPDNIKKANEDNLALMSRLLKQSQSIKSQSNCHWIEYGSSSCLMVDRFTVDRISKKQGVGKARKIGADIAANLIENNIIQTNWIHCTDADATLPSDYFDSVDQLSNSDVAGIYPFAHHSDDIMIDRASQCYEAGLNYYVRGLSYAGSPYAYHTIGSCIVINASAYCQVRGFPSRSAGEDFYLLNKLRKLGNILVLKCEPITLQGRDSDRVPFGTGPSITKLLDLSQMDLLNHYHYYNPLTFEHLKKIIELINQASLDQYSQLENASADSLRALGIDEFIEHLKSQAKSDEQRIRQSHQWFDAFKTLRFIHLLEGRGYKKQPLSQCIGKLDAMILKQ